MEISATVQELMTQPYRQKNGDEIILNSDLRKCLVAFYFYTFNWLRIILHLIANDVSVIKSKDFSDKKKKKF